MRTEDELILSFYQDLAHINNTSDVVVVQHKDSKKIYIKKTISTYDKTLYHRLRQMKVPGVPAIHHLIEDGEQLIVIEEYVGGTTLSDHLKDSGPLDLNTALDIMLHLCDILQILHESSPPIIHRDIKPSNIIVSPNGLVTLIDFNAAKLYDTAKTQDTILMGTVDYAAPEQFGFRQSDAKTDIYGLGILFNTLLTDTLPKNELAAGPARKVIAKCIHLDPEKRYHSVRQLQIALQRLQPVSQQKKESCGMGRQKKPVRFPYLPPGFRTMTPWKMIVALLGYAFCISISLSLQVEGAVTPAFLWANRIVSLAWLLFTIALCGNYMGLAAKFPFTKNPNIFVKTFGFCLWSFLFLVTVILLLSAFVPSQ